MNHQQIYNSSEEYINQQHLLAIGASPKVVKILILRDWLELSLWAKKALKRRYKRLEEDNIDPITLEKIPTAEASVDVVEATSDGTTTAEMQLSVIPSAKKPSVVKKRPKSKKKKISGNRRK